MKSRNAGKRIDVVVIIFPLFRALFDSHFMLISGIISVVE